jgi:FkbM family methyltransferase
MHVDLIEKHSFIADHLSADSRVLDLGASEGTFAMEIIRRYGCQVLGMEPVPSLVHRMPTHSRFTLEPAAIGHDDHPVTISLNPTMCASMGITEEGARSVEVPGMTLSRLLEKHKVDRVALLKVDIEGAEIPLFESATDADLHRIDQITIEYHDFLDPELREPVRGVDARLRALGFQKLKFSLDNTDVLYLHPRLHLPTARRTALLARYKYVRGVRRRVLAITRIK